MYIAVAINYLKECGVGTDKYHANVSWNSRRLGLGIWWYTVFCPGAIEWWLTSLGSNPPAFTFV